MMMTLAQAAGTEMGPLTLNHYLFVSVAMFCIGLIGFLTRRNLIIMFLCTEVMFQGVLLNLVAIRVRNRLSERYRGLES